MSETSNKHCRFCASPPTQSYAATLVFGSQVEQVMQKLETAYIPGLTVWCDKCESIACYVPEQPVSFIEHFTRKYSLYEGLKKEGRMIHRSRQSEVLP